jgi:hypothetical protein
MSPNFTYEIDNTNTVKIYDGINNDGPLIIQPTYPNGDEFENTEAAQTWAENWIADWFVQKEITEEIAQRKQSAIDLLTKQGYSVEEIERLIK